MKLYHLTLILFASITFFGCSKDWLNEKPDKRLTVPETLKDFGSLLDASTIKNSVLTISEVGTDGHHVSEASWQGTLSDLIRNAYTWTNDRPYISINDWNGAYGNILYANLVLEGLEGILPTIENQIEYNRVKGEALFVRARMFYELAQIFAPSFTAATASKDLSIPLRLGSDINIPSVRSTVKETYERIINDLMQAKHMLPIIPAYKTRASKPAVYGMLAKTYLQIQDYAKAGAYADSCLQLYSNLMDYNTLSTNTNFIGQFNDEVILHTTGYNYSALSSRLLMDADLYSLYDSNDLRKSIFYAVSGSDIKFKGNYYNSTSLLFFGLATDELFLIRAECHARNGNTTQAMQDLNDLLRTRWKKINGVSTYEDMTAANAEEALDVILEERKKELILRGVRWSDLRRLNADSRFAITLTRTIGGNTYKLEPNSYKYTFPIPEDVIEKSGMQQNTGWK